MAIPAQYVTATYDVHIEPVNAPNTDKYKLELRIGQKTIHVIEVSEAEAQNLLDAVAG